MEEPNTPATPQAGGTDPIHPQPQAGNTPPAEPQAGEPKPSLSAADYERMIAELRKENAGHRTKLNKFEADEKARADAQLTEQQKLQKQLAEMQSAQEEQSRAMLERTINYEVRLQAAALGVDPRYFDKVARIIEWENVEVDESGTPTNIKELVKKLVDDMPALLPLKGAATISTAGGPTAPARSQSVGNGEVTAAYVQDVMSGRIPWRELSQEQHTAVLNWQAKNAYRF